MQRLLSNFGRPKRPKTAPLASSRAAQLHERRAAELKRLGLCGRRPFSKYENALVVQVRTDPDSTSHITDKTVPIGWKRGMSVFADVHEVFASAGHAAIEEHEQEHEPAAAESSQETADTCGQTSPSMVLEFGRQTSCAWLEEERRVHELSEVVPGDLRQCARRHHVPMEIGWPWQWWRNAQGFVKVLVCRSRSCVPSFETSAKRKDLR